MKRSGNLSWSKEGVIGRLVIDNPPQNLITSPRFVDITDLSAWLFDPEIKMILVSGQGRNFSAGASLDYFAQKLPAAVMEEDFFYGRKILDCLDSAAKPTLAVIEGACLGAGLEIALACHMRICSERALFGFPEINHTIIPGLGGIKRLQKIVGKSQSLKIILTGELVEAGEAFRIRLVDQVAAKEELWDTARNLAKKITSKKSKAVNFANQAIANSINLPWPEAMATESRMFAELVADEFKNEAKTE